MDPAGVSEVYGSELRGAYPAAQNPLQAFKLVKHYALKLNKAPKLQLSSTGFLVRLGFDGVC